MKIPSKLSEGTIRIVNARWDETWHRLREWTNGQGPSERLAHQILLAEGYKNLDPSHPLGGPDGGKDALCTKDGKKWVLAVYFPRGQQSLSAIKKKLLDDLHGVVTNGADALAFVTNQEISVGERAALKEAAGDVHVELYHLERIQTILDAPRMAPVRKQFLGVYFSPTQEENERNTIEEIFGPDFEPNIIVLQPNEQSPGRDLQAYEYVRVRVYSDAFRRVSFEPEQEDAFLALVRQAFWEDSTASLEAPSDARVLVEHRPPDLRFHRRWGWWTMGGLAMASTLRDLHRPGIYSVADIVTDVVRFLALVGHIGRQLGGAGNARIVIGLDPGELRPAFDASDRIARERFRAVLGGVDSVARPVLERARETPVEITPRLEDLASSMIDLTSKCIVMLLRKIHGARISTEAFAASIPSVMEACRRAHLA